MPPQCPRRTGSGKCPSKPRATISSMCVAAAPPPPPCSCQEQVCTEESCAATAPCNKIKPEICPHGLADDDGECHGPCHQENADKHSLPREESHSIQMNQSKTSCCKPPTADKSQQAPADKMTPPVIESDTCCSGCPVKTPSSGTCCVSVDLPKDDYSQCGPDCGANESKQEDNCCKNAGGKASEPASQCPAMQPPAPPPEESTCCKSGGAIRSGPHMNQGTTPPTQQGPCGSRKPSLIRIPDTKKQKKPPAKQRSEASFCDKHKPPEPTGSTCPHSGPGLFPAKAAQTPCLCVMPPAYNMKCTGNLAGNCTCHECNK